MAITNYIKNWLRSQPKNDSKIIIKNGKLISGNDSYTSESTIEIKNQMPIRNRYFEYLDSLQKSKNTIETYKYGYEYWRKSTAKKLEHLKEDDIKTIIVKLDKNTAKNRICCLQNYAKFCLKNGNEKLFLELQKLDRIGSKKRIPKHKSRENFIELTAKAKDLINQKNRCGLWIAFMLNCGLRISEIEHAQRGSDYIQVVGKGDKERRVPAPSYLLHAMQHIGQGRGGWRKNRTIISRELRKLNINHPHSLRHTYATMLLREGLTIQQIQQLLGHESIATTQIYARTQLPENVVKTLEAIK